MTAFNHPSSQASRWQGEAFCRLPALLQSGRIPLLLTSVPRRFPRVPFVAAEVLRGAIPWVTTVQDPICQRRGQQRDIRCLGPADDEGQRDATPVHQQAVLAPIFFPDLSGSVRRPLARTGLWSAIMPLELHLKQQISRPGTASYLAFLRRCW